MTMTQADLAADRAARALASGALAILPTETVYGLAADAGDPRARPIPARHTPRRRAKTEKHGPAYKIPLHKLYSHRMCRGRGL